MFKDGVEVVAVDIHAYHNGAEDGDGCGNQQVKLKEDDQQDEDEQGDELKNCQSY